MADAAVTFLLENLTQLLRYHVHLISEAKNELEELKNEVDLMNAFLVGAAQKPKKEETFRERERQIREVVYEAEDTIDACLTHAATAKGAPKGKLDKWLRGRRSSAKRLSMAAEVKSLRENKVKPMFEAMKDFVNAQSGDGSGTRVEEPSTRLKKVQLIRQDNIVGFEEEENTIVNYLREERRELDVISIVGMPGLGKTTLAWKIFQNPDIQYEFPTRIWVYVSQEFNTRDVFLNILRGFTKQDMSSMSDRDLVMEVQQCLVSGKFLLVMDDVWTVEAWNDIKHVLPKSNKMGKVLITSHSWEVGKHANVNRKPHQLRFLNPKESWELLQFEVFGNLEDCPEELKTIGEAIAEKCAGLPNALVIIGRILMDQLSATKEMIEIQNAWKDVCENVSMHFRNKEQHMSEIVALSYNNLPHDLKDCFLYLGVFPEDYEIPVWTLTHLWIAEGFVRHKVGQSLEETAEENLKDLINRNLVMVVKTNPNGQVKTCRVHDVIREFCNLKAGIAEQNLFQEIKMSKQGVFEPSVSDIQKYRRLCIHFHLPEFLTKCRFGKQKGNHIRSFLCFYKESILLDPKCISTIPDTFDLLRILHSKSVKFTEFPVKVTKLVHLRYITLSCDHLSELPDAITNLWNLQTLVVDTNSRTLEIKASIWKMFQLRHLKTKAAIILATQGEGEGGENLETLSRLSPENCTQDVFSRAGNLKRLGVRGDLAILFKDMSLAILDHLENLKLVNDLFLGSASEDPLRGLPAAACFPKNIKTLTLAATFLDWTHMSTLGMIDSLQVLKLKQNAFKGKSWQVVDNGFRGLQFLLIASTDLHRWETSDDHFPSLRCLVLKNCQDLCKIPLGLAKTLQVLDIERVSKSVIESAREIEKYKKEMQGQRKGRWGEFKLSIGPGCE